MGDIILILSWFICGFFAAFIFHYFEYMKAKENKNEYYITVGEIFGAILAIAFGLISLVIICVASNIFDKKIFRIKTNV